MNNIKDNTVYTVDRNSPDDCEQGTTIALFSSALTAKRYARKLNKEMGHNIKLDAEGDMEEVLNEEDFTFFDTGAFEVDDHVNDLYNNK